MAKKNRANITRHIQSFDLPNELTDEILINWYQAYQPIGSGPLNMGRTICALIETIAAERGIELPPAQGLKS